MVRAESSIRSLADLAGKTVALGEPGSGTNANARVLLAEGANAATEEQLRQVIRDAGFRPVQRDTLYRTMFLN